MKNLVIAALGLLLTGCATKPEPLAEPPTKKQSGNSQTTAQGGNSEGIGITSPEVGGLSPVSGSDSIAGGGGGGIQQAAKRQAMGAAAKESGGSLSRGGGSDDQ